MRRRLALAGGVLALALGLPAAAAAAHVGVGVLPGWSAARLAARIAQRTGARSRTLIPGSALTVDVRDPAALRRVPGVAYVTSLTARRQLAFSPNDPLATRQWYLQSDKAFDFWDTLPQLPTVKVAVIDSGLDCGAPEFQGRVAAARSFVGGSPCVDTDGHGTFVAGEIAANPFNGVGIAGLAFNAKLLVAKVTDSSCNVSTEGEIDGIRWAVDHGARVINLSIGGTRDPEDSQLDSFSPPEEAAVQYAYSRGVLVVAAVGNGTSEAKMPWNWADYPAALPHVLGVAAVKQNGAVPDYSNRDKQYVDIAAPGGPIFSTIPRNLVDSSLAGCTGVPYSTCGPSEFKDGIGTSFAAPQVTAAAALLLGVDPKLTPSQTEWILERSARDANPSTGCNACPVGRDSLTGWGVLDVAAALKLLGNGTKLPPADALEPNDDAGQMAHAFGPPRTITATLDYWDDPIDVYSIHLGAGDELFARLGLDTVAPTSLYLWKPGTVHVTGPPREVLASRAARSTEVGGQQRLGYVAPVAGTYYLEVTIRAPSRPLDRYTLSVAVRKAAKP